MAVIGITPGSERGVGPELMLRALADQAFLEHEFIWCGDKASLVLGAQRAQMRLEFEGTDIAFIGPSRRLRFLPKNKEQSDYKIRQAWFLEEALELGLKNKFEALVTGPIEKAALSCFGEQYAGQTELFAKYWAIEGQKALMVFSGGPFILSLLTTHISFVKIAPALSIEKVHSHIMLLAKALSPVLKKPVHKLSIDILALNPHAGEDGLLGTEEIEILLPAINQAKKEGLMLCGPWPTDGYFAYYHEKTSHPDALIAIYHDQGLAPYKLLSEGAGVNITLGLKMIRTSPAHGTAENLVGTGRASLLSSLCAIDTAIKFK